MKLRSIFDSGITLPHLNSDSEFATQFDGVSPLSYLHAFPARHCPQRTQRSKSSHGLERLQVTCSVANVVHNQTEKRNLKVKGCDRKRRKRKCEGASKIAYHNNGEVKPAPGIFKVLLPPKRHPLEKHLSREDHRESFVEDVEDSLQPNLLIQVRIFERLWKERWSIKSGSTEEAMRRTYEGKAADDNHEDDEALEVGVFDHLKAAAAHGPTNLTDLGGGPSLTASCATHHTEVREAVVWRVEVFDLHFVHFWVLIEDRRAILEAITSRDHRAINVIDDGALKRNEQI